MRRRRIGVAALTTLLVTLLALIAACGESQPPPRFTGTDNEETAPPEAQNVILNALQIMYTWSPAKDASTADAYNRALPFLGNELRAGANNRVERGGSVWWQQWKAQRAEVTAEAKLVPAEHPDDTPDTVARSVVLTQTVKSPDGRVLDSATFNIDRVVAKKGRDGWRVEAINFFPVNRQTQACAPGQSPQPPPNGPCSPNPAPPTKQCPDGSAVAPDQACPPPGSGPKTRTCPNGTTVPANSACPSTGAGGQPTGQPTTGSTAPEPTAPATPSSSVPSSSTAPSSSSTPPPATSSSAPPSYTTCPDGTSVPNGQTCAPKTCPGGTTVPNGGSCPTTKTCSYSNGSTTVDINAACPAGRDCGDGDIRKPASSCPFDPKSFDPRSVPPRAIPFGYLTGSPGWTPPGWTDHRDGVQPNDRSATRA